jgi:starvation-inducible DNA-binding protein
MVLPDINGAIFTIFHGGNIVFQIKFANLTPFPLYSFRISNLLLDIIEDVRREMTMENQLVSVLNKQIANWSVLYMKLHNYHWYVKGEQFFTLHVKFEEFYNEAGLHVDELAERLLAIGGKPVATMKECLEISSIQEATGQEAAHDMVQAIINDFSQTIGELKEGMALAAEMKDETTGDILLAIHSGLEKHVWMLTAFLGKTI